MEPKCIVSSKHHTQFQSTKMIPHLGPAGQQLRPIRIKAAEKPWSFHQQDLIQQYRPACLHLRVV